jgi:hypothetical protein
MTLGLDGIRDGFILINKITSQISEKSEIPLHIVNVGESLNDGTGDLLTVALAKIASNLSILLARTD